MTNKPVIYWDSCVFLALILGERRDRAEATGIRELVRKVDDQEVILLTSVVMRAEVHLATLTAEQRDALARVLQRSNVRLAEMTEAIAVKAGELRHHYQHCGDGFDNLTASDAYHLATAIVMAVDEFFTFDATSNKRKRGLLPMDGNVMGYPLKISRPFAVQPELGDLG